MAADRVTLLVGTRKGAWILRSDPARDRWDIDGPHFLGHIVNHLVADPRDRRTVLMAARTGHLGPTMFRSTDAGRTWSEVTRPPAFPKAGEHGEPGRVLRHTFWLEPGLPEEPGVWYGGGCPQSLWRSEDGGESWEPVRGWNDHPRWADWTAAGEDATPDGAILHSITLDPRDPAHFYVGCSSGGVFETVDGGADWVPLNAGSRADFMPDPYPEWGQDTHCLRLHPANPDVLWQQSHCGIYRMERAAAYWERVGDNMPRDVGDIGFPIVLHPREPDTAWVFPMDGTDVWPRTSPGGRPAVYVTRDAGASWSRLDEGLPPEQAWLTVLRQSMTADTHDPAGLYFGTTAGQVWGSTDEGEHWRLLARHLPHVFSVEAVALDGA